MTQKLLLLSGPLGATRCSASHMLIDLMNNSTPKKSVGFGRNCSGKFLQFYYFGRKTDCYRSVGEAAPIRSALAQAFEPDVLALLQLDQRWAVKPGAGGRAVWPFLIHRPRSGDNTTDDATRTTSQVTTVCTASIALPRLEFRIRFRRRSGSWRPLPSQNKAIPAATANISASTISYTSNIIFFTEKARRAACRRVSRQPAALVLPGGRT